VVAFIPKNFIAVRADEDPSTPVEKEAEKEQRIASLFLWIFVVR
jgi:hypothetical protein